MKKLILIAMGMIVLQNTSNAQNEKKVMAVKTPIAEYVSIGPVGGFGCSWVSNMGGTNRFNPAGNIGIGLVYARNEHWGWGTQLTLSSEGYSVDYNKYNAYSMPLYLRLPVRVYYFFGDFRNTVRPKLYLGPQIGYKVAENDNLNGYYSDVAMARNTGNFRTYDFGINGGAGLNVKLANATWLNLDLNYYQGLTDAVKDAAGNSNMNINLGFNAGLLFGIW